MGIRSKIKVVRRVKPVGKEWVHTNEVMLHSNLLLSIMSCVIQ